MYWDDLLTNPGAQQEALELTSCLKLLCQMLGLVTTLDVSVNLTSGYHISGNRTGNSCWPHQPYDKRVTNGYPYWRDARHSSHHLHSVVHGHILSIDKLVTYMYGRKFIRSIQW